MRPRWILPPLALAAAVCIVWFALRASTPATGADAAGGRVDPYVALEPDAALAPAAESSAEADTPDRGARRATGTTGVIVRVLQRDSRAPLEDFYASMKSARDFLGEGRSDASGRIRFPAPGRDGATVALEGPFGWSIEEPVRRVEFREDGRYDTLEFTAYQAGVARFRARLVDRLTSEPVPHYLVRVGTHDGRREDVVSDAAGVLVSEADYPEGDVRLWCYDVFNPAVGANEANPFAYFEVPFRIGADGRAIEQDLSIPVGPTYRLAMDVPDDVARRWSADMRIGPRAWMSTGRAKETPVRWNDGPWIRFQPSRVYGGQFESSLTLVVTSDDGVWRGTGSVRSSRGIDPEPVQIALERRGRVLARVLDPGGEPIAGADVFLAPAGEVDGSRLPMSQLSVANGLVEFELVAPGSYCICALTEARERTSRRFALEAGQRVDLELVLSRAKLEGAIEGRLIVPQDLELDPGTLFLSSIRPEGRHFEQWVTFERRGDVRVAEFRFADLPAGDYQLWPSWFEAQWTPHRVRVASPARGVEIRGRARIETLDYGFEVSDAVDGSPLERFGVSIQRGDGTSESRELWSSLNFNRGASFGFEGEPGHDQRWTIFGANHLPRTIALDDLEMRDDARLVRVALERGWSLEIRMLGPGLAPLPGVQFFVDGIKTAESDSAGTVFLKRDRPPTRIEARYLDWLCESEGTLALQASLQNGAPSVVLLFSPR